MSDASLSPNAMELKNFLKKNPPLTTWSLQSLVKTFNSKWLAYSFSIFFKIIVKKAENTYLSSIETCPFFSLLSSLFPLLLLSGDVFMIGWGGIGAEAETVESVVLFEIFIISSWMLLWLDFVKPFLEKIIVYCLLNEELHNTDTTSCNKWTP